MIFVLRKNNNWKLSEIPFANKLPKSLLRELPEPEESDKDVLLGVLVAEEGLPPAVGHVVPSDQLDLIRSNLWKRPIAPWRKEESNAF